MLCRTFLLSLTLAVAWLNLCHGRLDLSDTAMQDAVNDLSSRFYGIRNEGLGIDSLENAYRGAKYISSPVLEDSEIQELLRDVAFSSAFDSIVELFDNVSSVAMSLNESTTAVTSCCDSSAGSAPVCAYTPSDVSVNSDIAEVLAGFSPVTNGQVMFGATDGSIVRVPSRDPPGNCIPEDSRLQPWFVREVRMSSNRLEVVLLVEVVNDTVLQFTTTAEHQATTVEAASLVINSLSTADMVGVVGMGKTNTIANGNSEVVPVCLDTIVEMDAFIASLTATSRDARLSDIDFVDGFRKALSLFSSSAQTDKLLLFFTLGNLLLLQRSRTDVLDVIDEGPNGVSISLYRAADGSIVPDGIFTGNNVLLDPLRLPNQIGDYYSIPEDIDSFNELTVGRDNSDERNTLTLSRPIFNNETDFLGVVYAVLPFNELLDTRLFEFTRRRPYSYAFVVDQDQQPFFHPLLPGEITDDISILNLEPEGVITDYLNSNSAASVAVNKEHLIFGGMSDRSSYISHKVPSTYWCSRVTVDGGRYFSVCLVLADEERRLLTLDHGEIDVRSRYESQDPPVYHNVLMSVANNSLLCNYFCKYSVNDRLSFQLTTPSMPTSENMSIIAQLRDYIGGSGTRPDYVEVGVAEEAALGMVVSKAWLNSSSSPSDYITRRHLATPNGLYLTYPPAHLLSGFQPTISEWYVYSSVRQLPVTITPPHRDPLAEGSRLTVSVGHATRTPSSLNDQDFDGGRTLAVVSGEVTLNALRVFVREALPMCEQRESVQCIIVDDTGNLIYERELGNFDGEGSFFGLSVSRVRTIVSDLKSSLITKKQCASLFNSMEKTRRFYILNTTMDGVVRSSPGHCGEYMIQLIPGTNAFFIVYEDVECRGSFCSCSSSVTTCINCLVFSPGLCECPCNCVEDCQPLPTDIPVCPAPPSLDVNYFPADPADAVKETDNLCFNQTCNCRPDLNSCFGVRDCHWCEGENKCVQNTECCNSDEGPSCCRAENYRFEDFCYIHTVQCYDSPEGFLDVTCPLLIVSQTSTIAAAVVGVIIGVLLITLIVALFVYYQFFRKTDPAEETSRESAFDFSNKAAMVIDGSGVVGKRKGSKTQSNDSEKGKDKADMENQREVTPTKEKDETTL